METPSNSGQSSSSIGAKKNIPGKKQKNAGPLHDIQQPSASGDTNPPRKQMKTRDDLAAKEALQLTDGAENLQPRQRTTFRDKIHLMAQM